MSTRIDVVSVDMLTGHSVFGVGYGTFAFMGMVCAVYGYVWNFHNWYMTNEIGLLGFSGTYAYFMSSMSKYLTGSVMVMVLSWEEIGLMSMLLIGYWYRSEAYGSSYAAVLYNRMGDLSIMLLLLCVDVQYMWLLLIVSALGKSAIWIFGYWLPMAMESPTPVSSLLHSSTMVVASVFLAMLMLDVSMLLPSVGLLMMSLYLSSWYDSKKMIALSTSVHLVVMLIAVSSGMYGLVLFHIVTHGFVKASAFVNSSWYIHMTGSQDLRTWGIQLPSFIMIMSFLILCGIGGSLVSASKEYILLGVYGVVIMVMGWGYTKNFMNNIDGGTCKYMMDASFLTLMMTMGGLSFMSLEVVMMVFIVMCTRLMHMGNMYVVNK